MWRPRASGPNRVARFTATAVAHALALAIASMADALGLPMKAAVVLFAGMGGACSGLERAGVRVRLAVDGWDAACVAHRRWMPKTPVVRARCEAPPVNGARPWLLWASPSCKPYSTANRTPKRGKVHPEYYSTALLVRQMVAMGARWLVMENVGGLLWSKEGKVELAEMRAEAQRHGLRWNASIVNSNTCGVAQIRRRLFVVVGPEYVRIPHGSDYIPPENAEVASLTRDRHPEGKAGWRDGGRQKCPARSVVGPFGTSTNPHTGAVNAAGQAKRGVVHARLPSRDGVRGMMGARFLRRDEGTRARTLAECAALQCVPMEPLAGFSKRVAHELVGNAVPWSLAEHVARALIRADS